MKTRTLTAVLVACLAIIGLSAGYQALTQGIGGHEVARIGQPKTISGSTRVTFQIDAGGGRLDSTAVSASSLHLSGASLQGLLKRFPGWQVKKDSSQDIVLQPKSGVDPLSLGLRSGYVAIFYGSPHAGVVAQLTGIPVSHLLPADKARLQHGIAMRTLDRAWQALEGLSG